MNSQKSDLSFSNFVVDKKQLKNLIIWAFRNYGIARASNMVDRLKDLGFCYATKAGISLSLEDLRIPPVKKKLLENTKNMILQTEDKYERGDITAVERFQKIIDTWNNSSEMLKKEIIEYFKSTDPLNSIYMMAFSGARGNISQVRQLVGMRGLMSDPQGQIIDLPIANNFREGLTTTDYFISSYGARKGLVDTALRTADSGYLTRRLVDVAQDVIIREIDCQTTKGILLEAIVDNNKTLVGLEQALIGRVLAEDVVMSNNGKIIALANQEVDDLLARHIVESNISKVLVRSPITCMAVNSVCQRCYGWNLAHGKLVDLGEAVGIIAAQSIGEPGTQLTMRTFHTGGVFTGEFSERYFAPFDCMVEYSGELDIVDVRTRYGDQGFKMKRDGSLIIHQKKSKYSQKIFLSQDSTILVKNRSFIPKGQVISEYPVKSRFLTESAQKVIVSDISGKVYFSDLIVEEVQNKQNLVRTAQTSGLIWVLSAQVYVIPHFIKINVRLDERVNNSSILALAKTQSKYSGFIRIIPKNQSKSYQEILVVVASYIFDNAILSISEDPSALLHYNLTIDKQDKFLLRIKPNQPIFNNQIIGELISNAYYTETGGIVKYLDLHVTRYTEDLEDCSYNILSPGYILWIAEETHKTSQDISLLLVRRGDTVKAGTKIFNNLIANVTGIIDFIIKDNLVREVVIKPYKSLYTVSDMIVKSNLKRRGFLRPGENIIDDIQTDQLVYWEYMIYETHTVLLIRPVIVYSVPKKSYSFTLDNIPNQSINLHIARRITVQDGVKIKSVEGINLIKTYLVVSFEKDMNDLNCFIETPKKNKVDSCLKFIIAHKILLKDQLFSFKSSQYLTVKNRVLVNDNQFIFKGESIAQTELLSRISGQIIDIQESNISNQKILLLTDLDCCNIDLQKREVLPIKKNQWIYKGEEIIPGLKAPESGQVINHINGYLKLRIGRPYLISSGSILHVDHNNLLQKGENIATLIFNRIKTGDIVQGLPRIEEILEARKKNDSLLNPHLLLDQRFNFYLNRGLTLVDATRISLQEIQLLLLKEIQLVYQSQNVDISDKHVEVIVRQMTSKVKVEQGGDTKYLPGEIVSLQKIETVNQSLLVMDKIIATYRPILLGITKASLNTDSFISAASFQETTKVLTEAAISGKLDWLRGLKENVIIGRLIPAGTGFTNYSQHTKTPESRSNNLSDVERIDYFSDEVLYNLDDIILDDRTAKNFSI
uniref:DNA-directed RNA polymerase n=1 Tax=Neogoniolithon spectabile TaxID=231755 RepID=A0A3G3MGW7_9FLOR|nr:RNA polymerase beta'' subunit [Neogoniolithon spectabile]AYR06075.1 RNA polymerase beta'' subunit [Neogoniolithon spectabile]